MGLSIRGRRSNGGKKIALPREASVFSTELCTIGLALQASSDSGDNAVVVFTDSHSAMQCIQDIFTKNPLTTKIQHTYLSENRDICWMLAHVGIAGNEAVDEAAKGAAAQKNLEIVLYYKDFYLEINSRIELIGTVEVEQNRGYLRNILETTETLTAVTEESSRNKYVTLWSHALNT